MKTTPGHYLDKLASLRFFAALLVLFSHINLAPLTHNKTIQYVSHNVFSLGFIGVSVFYVLSGFVISYANDNWAGWKRYLIGRVSRIYPPHLIVTLLFIVIFGETIRGWSDARIWLANFTLMQSWFPYRDYVGSLNDVSWSLSVEIFFYVAFIFLRRLDDRQLYLLCIASYVLNLTLECALQSKPFWPMLWLFGNEPVARLPEFLMGMTIYRIYKSGAAIPYWIANLDFFVTYMLMVATLSLLHFFGVNYIFFYSSVPAPFAYLMVISLALGGASRYMKNRVLVLLGEASFALYLIHKAMFRIGHELIHRFHTPASLYVMLFVAIVAVAASVFFYLKVEVPVTRHVRRFLSEWLLVGSGA